MVFGLGGFDYRWYFCAVILLLLWFAAIMNWKWSNQLRKFEQESQPRTMRLSLATMLAVMTLLAVQFAIAALFLRLDSR
jgi:1,4-dihydroxy-2-naphthoate octaprenyltransferase